MRVSRRVTQIAIAAAVATIAIVPATPVLAADAVDQSGVGSGSAVFIHDLMWAGQTFTAGATGSLNRVDLVVGRLDNPGSLNVTIQTAPGGVPSGVVLASATVPVTGLPDDGTRTSITVALPASMATAGDQYAIVLAAPAAKIDTTWVWQTSTTDVYAGGTAVESVNSGATWTVGATADRTFATWVDTAPCPGGFFSWTGFGPCTPADAGHFATGPGATSQSPCAKGTFQDAAGQASCLPAPIGFYVETTGATAATTCPDGTTTAAPGATSAAACVANDPTISCVASPNVLWPANNKFVPVAVTLATTNAATVRLVSATGNDGATAGDLTGWAIGTADTSGNLRASRSGGGSGRTYSLTYEAASTGGGTAQCTATVFVPHDQGKH